MSGLNPTVNQYTSLIRCVSLVPAATSLSGLKADEALSACALIETPLLFVSSPPHQIMRMVFHSGQTASRL